MPELPWGYLGSVLVALVAAVLALRPISTNGPRVTPAFVIGSASSEVPGLFLLALAGTKAARAM